MPDGRRTEVVCYRSLLVRMSGQGVAAMASGTRILLQDLDPELGRGST
jgi:hypothetical protein